MSDTAKPDPSDESLVLEYEFDAPPAKVWRAVTVPELRERWLPDCDLAGAEPETSIPGEEVRYRMRDSEPPFRESRSSSRSSRMCRAARAFVSSSGPARSCRSRPTAIAA